VFISFAPHNLGRYEQQEKQLGNRSRAIGISKQFVQDGFQKLERELVFSSKILPKTSKKIFIKY
jgi:hypothetical protein